MDQRLKGFLQGLLHHAIRSGIFAAFWKMPLKWVLLAVAAMIAIAVVFKLY